MEKNSRSLYVKDTRKEKAFQVFLSFSSFLFFLLWVLLAISLLKEGWAIFQKEGFFSFLFQDVWDPVKEDFGALSFLAGTLFTSFLALLISFPFSFSIGIFLGEYYTKGKIAEIIHSLVGLIAAIPSVIYGLWGLFYITPIVAKIQKSLGYTPTGVSTLSAIIVLSIMIIPYAAFLIKESLQMVPTSLKEGGLALGATRWEVIWKISIPYAKAGILSGYLLALGRALGETMAVTMLIGNAKRLPSLFQEGNTLASIIANEFAEADHPLHYSSLMALGFLLLILNVSMNLIATWILKKMGGRRTYYEG